MLEKLDQYINHQNHFQLDFDLQHQALIVQLRFHKLQIDGLFYPIYQRGLLVARCSPAQFAVKYVTNELGSVVFLFCLAWSYCHLFWNLFELALYLELVPINHLFAPSVCQF